MRHQIPTAADLAPRSAILALVSEAAAAAALEQNFPGMSAALDRVFGKRGWFMFWDEDLAGKPVRGTISVAYGKETLVVG